jgi:glycosyltransferase 2 family protein
MPKVPYKLLVNFFVSILILFLIFKFAKIDFQSFWEQLKQTDLFWFGISSFALLITIFTNCYRWHILTRLLDYDLRFAKAIKIYFEASFGNNFLPTNIGGDAFRAYELGKPNKSWLRAASTVLVERMLGFLVMFAILPVGLVYLQFSVYKNSFPEKLSLALWAVFILTVLGILSYKLWSKLPLGLVQKIKYAVEEYTKCQKSLFKVTLWTFITHFFLYLGNIFAAKSVGVDFSSIPIWYWILLIPAATLASFIIPALKGLGAKEAAYVSFLGILGISPEKALAIAFINFISTFLISLPGISLVFRKLVPVK